MEKAKFNASIFVGSEKATRKCQKEYVNLFQPGQRVLDIGCGAGVFLDLLKDAHVIGVGVDSSDIAIVECKKKNLEAYNVDAFRFLTQHSNEFHGVFCSHFVEHFEPKTVLDLFAHVHTALAPQGVFIIITPNFKNIEVVTETFWLDISHVRPYPIPLLLKMLEFAGFEIVHSGTDPNTDQRLPKRKPWLAPGYLIKKIRFGKYFGKGDAFVVAKKTDMIN